MKVVVSPLFFNGTFALSVSVVLSDRAFSG